MKGLKDFNIPFVGLKEDSHQFQYQIDKKFFEAFQYDEFHNANITVDLLLVKKATLFELNFNCNGAVNIPCDLTSELYDQSIEGTMPLIVKFGPEFDNENEEILILPYDEYQINVAQYIYELIILSVPTKRVHPDVVKGIMESDALKRLKELEIQKEKTVEEETTDPRWDKLKDLLTGKNT